MIPSHLLIQTLRDVKDVNVKKRYLRATDFNDRETRNISGSIFSARPGQIDVNPNSGD